MDNVSRKLRKSEGLLLPKAFLWKENPLGRCAKGMALPPSANLIRYQAASAIREEYGIKDFQHHVNKPRNTRYLISAIAAINAGEATGYRF